MPVIQLNNLRDTTLWKRLDTGFSGTEGELARTLATNLDGICREAYDRMRAFPSLHPEYTLHDEVHLLRVTELMSKIIPATVGEQLNPIEIALLILSAHFHDQGMVLEREEIAALSSDPKFKIFQDNWEIDHPNLKDVKRCLSDRSLSDREQEHCREIEHELKAALLSDYVRMTHGERAASYIRTTFSSDARWIACGTNLAELVAKLCSSHIQSAIELIPANGFRYDESVGPYRVNMAYLGIILRLADILDFDRDRTPDSLYRTIDFRNPVSLQEWEKHRSVDGWTIEPTSIQFTMRCEHPEYQRAAYQFMDWIDKELADALYVCHSFPAHTSRYRLDLPLVVDRSRIEPKDQSYIYHDLEFSLSRDEIVKLLMTDELYGAPWIAVRELLQNALDALRYRKALIKRDNGTDWLLGKVDLKHSLDEHGHEVVRCTDNGAGMDQSTIERFLTKVGRSYYRSPEFEQERAGFRATGVDFDPCAQFGIGFMSCFMLGDNIIIRTRRDYGTSRGQGDPLIVEINGLGGIVVIRKGPDDQPIGTAVEILGRKKPHFLDKYMDQVRLIAVLDGFALACEFPIEGHCTIPEIAGSISIPPETSTPRIMMEDANIKSCATLEYQFSRIDPLLNGCVRASFLVDDAGHYTLSNTEASWRPGVEPAKDSPSLVDTQGQPLKQQFRHLENQTCLDGILVAGEPGRADPDSSHEMLGQHSNPIELGNLRFILDIRGPIKPPLAPNRTPPRGLHYGPFSSGPRWDYIQMLVNRAGGRLWEQVAAQLTEGLDSETFWQLSSIYNKHSIQVCNMQAGVIWSRVSAPVVYEDGRHEWKSIATLGLIEPVLEEKDEKNKALKFVCMDGGYVGAYDNLTKWSSSANWHLQATVASMSTVTIRDGKTYLELRPPCQPETPPWEFVLSGFNTLMTLPYSGELREFVSVHMPIRNVNRDHPLVKIALEARYLESRSELQTFALSAIWFLSDPKNLELLSNPKSKVGRWPMQIGSLYKDVDWPNIATEYHPPYKIRFVNGNSIQATSEDFERWASSRPDSAD